MKWVPQDVELYLKAKEYVDTAIIPLIPLSFGEDMKQAASMSEFITLIAARLERQFTGRIFLLPPYTYLTIDAHEKNLSELESWTSILKGNQMKHLFFLTSDSEWKIHEESFRDTLVWIPAVPFDNLEDSQKYSIIDSHASQLFTFFTRKWQDGE